jgi:hypothetical protein
MAITRLRRPSGLTEILTQICNAIDEALAKLLPSLVREGAELRGEADAGITFAAGVSRQVAHKLGRVPTRWWVVRDFGASAHDLLETGRDDKFLTLVSSTACTVYLWVG